MGGASEKLMSNKAFRNAKSNYMEAAKTERDYNSSIEGKNAIKERSKLSVVERQKLRKSNREDELNRRK